MAKGRTMTAGQGDHLATLRAFYNRRTEGLCMKHTHIEPIGLWVCLLPAGHEGGCR